MSRLQHYTSEMNLNEIELRGLLKFNRCQTIPYWPFMSQQNLS